MKKVFFLSFCFSFFYQSLCAITFLVHGTFAKDETWFKSGGDFYTTYSSLLTNEHLISFTWSGKLSHEERLVAAHDLSKKIISYYSDEVTVIGHSHGGNVINLASHLLEAAWYSVQNAYQGPASHKINAMLKLFIPEPCFIQQDYPFSYTREYLKALDAQEHLRSVIHEKVQLLCDQMLEIGQEVRFVKKKYVIRRAQYLAVPVMLANYAPNMKIIGQLEHYYAENDWIQLVGGTEGALYPLHPRITQFKLLFADSATSKNLCNADHFSIHNDLVARWLARPEALDLITDQGRNYMLILHRDLSVPRCEEVH
jgi:hypothetical protein